MYALSVSFFVDLKYALMKTLPYSEITHLKLVQLGSHFIYQLFLIDVITK